jgi:RecA/RadA recombinase
MGLEVLWLDAEHRFFFDYFESLGVDLSKLELEDTQLAEGIFDAAEEWVRTRSGLIILDSIGGLLTRKESEKRSGEEGFPEAPKLIPGFIRRIAAELASLSNKECCLLLLNHEKIDFGTGAIKVLGGRVIEHHVTQWVRLRGLPNKLIKQGEQRIGKMIEASVCKGKNEGLKCELAMLTGQGFERNGSLMEEAKRILFVKKGQVWFWGDEKLGRGDNVLRERFKDETFVEKINEAIENKKS